ncbi:MAG: ATP-binding protein [Myxococcota bacterium]
MRALLKSAQASGPRGVMVVLVAVVYFGLARLSLLLAFHGTNASPVWPPSGFALTMVLLFGRSTAPGIALGALIANAVTFITNGAALDARVLLASLIIALGNASEALICSAILRQSRPGAPPLRNALVFVLASGLASAVAASIGAATVVFGGFAPGALLRSIFVTWCTGDWVGILLITPLILSFLPPEATQLRVGRILPTVVVCVAALAIWLVARESAPAGSEQLNRSLLRLQAGVGAACVLGLVLGAVRGTHSEVSERRLAPEPRTQPDARARIGPTIAGLGVLAISLALWRSVLQDQEHGLAAATKAATNNVVDSLEASLRAHSRATERLAARWNRTGGVPAEEWRESARALILDFGGFEALAWVDENGALRFREAITGAASDVERLTPAELERLRARRPAELNGTPTRAVSHERGPLLVFAVPLGSKRAPDGFMLGAVRLNNLFDDAIRRVAPDFEVRLSVSEGLVLGSTELVGTAQSRIERVQVPGRLEPIQVEVRASPQKARGLRSALPEVILGGGSILSAMVASLLFLAQEVLRRERKARMDGARLLRMNEALAEERKRAEAAAKAKSEFLANMSHELRTPMSAVVGLSALLGGTQLDDEQREYVDDLALSSNLLRQLIDDILDLSKLDAGKVTLEQTSFAPRAHLEKLVKLVARSATEKGLTLDLEVDDSVPDWLSGDPLRLGQILLNLLSNAVKFTDRGRIRVRASATLNGSEGATMRYEVSDTGRGIDSATLKRLFAPFSQADASTTRRFGGTGLGLYISRSLVQLMGGELSCESEPQKGTIFSFTVKAALAGPAMPSSRLLPKAAPANASPVSRRTRILVAEDNAVNRKIAVRLLEHLGHDVDVASDGAAALAAARATHFDLILMDWQMPEMDGLQATAAIRSELGAEVPIVALTANAMEGDRDRCLAAGMNDYLTKPLSMEALKSMLQRWLPNANATPQGVSAKQ